MTSDSDYEKSDNHFVIIYTFKGLASVLNLFYELKI